ncbi:FemAB family XrtA/PEP-CTERM system-associated protein (plasmid) [Tundrisphaera lichenicola]|uniref:FemAB family XrtA/PEP-CTERM system-associated protein n=1 Tax=Tundrisphaera lichenicola TaxID=2029860 RepID=UPI003EBDFF28
MSSIREDIVIRIYQAAPPAGHFDRWETFVRGRDRAALSYHPAWPQVLGLGLRHAPYWIEASTGDEICGLLPLCLVRSLLFGRFLVGLPYLNYGGPIAESDEVAGSLIDRAVELAGQLGASRLELRHESVVDHPALMTRAGHKVNMKLALASTTEGLWKALGSSVRNQVRKGEKSGLTVHWGGEERLAEFYDVFSRNMRDLGTPVFGQSLFSSALRAFPGQAELCVVRIGPRPVAAAMLLHGWGITEVPSASSLKKFNNTCANMLMYHRLLARAIERGQAVFDFGRSSPESPTFRFKKQWGAEPHSANWQYLLNAGGVADTSREDPRYERLIRIWRRLPVPLTRWIGPPIVRGIP